MTNKLKIIAILLAISNQEFLDRLYDFELFDFVEKRNRPLLIAFRLGSHLPNFRKHFYLEPQAILFLLSPINAAILLQEIPPSMWLTYPVLASR